MSTNKVMPTTDNRSPITLPALKEKHYDSLEVVYSALQKREYQMVVMMHFKVIELLELQKVDIVNEKIFRGIDDFRAYLDSEAEKLGPYKDVQEKTHRLIGSNKRLRERRGVVDGHDLWFEDSYLYSQQDARDAFLKLCDDEWKRCRGHVIAEGVTTWQIIDIPNWVTYLRGDLSASIPPVGVGAPTMASPVGVSAPTMEYPANIEPADVEKYMADLKGYLASEDRARAVLAELVLVKKDLVEKADYLTRSYAKYRKSNERDVAVEIFAMKKKVLSLWRMHLQIERLEEENNRYS